jgi:hypothetical protein
MLEGCGFRTVWAELSITRSHIRGILTVTRSGLCRLSISLLELVYSTSGCLLVDPAACQFLNWGFSRFFGRLRGWYRECTQTIWAMLSKFWWVIIYMDSLSSLRFEPVHILPKSAAFDCFLLPRDNYRQLHLWSVFTSFEKKFKHLAWRLMTQLEPSSTRHQIPLFHKRAQEGRLHKSTSKALKSSVREEFILRKNWHTYRSIPKSILALFDKTTLIDMPHAQPHRFGN